MTPDLDRIIAGLSEAQRKAMLVVTIEPGKVSQVAVIGHISVFRALERRGLLEHRIIAMVSCTRHTPLGLAVRQRLQEMNDAS